MAIADVEDAQPLPASCRTAQKGERRPGGERPAVDVARSARTAACPPSGEVDRIHLLLGDGSGGEEIIAAR